MVIVIVALGIGAGVRSAVFFGASPEFTVSMDEDKFTPETLEIPVGGQIKFINQSEKARWPASNLHPTHGIYPEFDPTREIASGESWIFKFKNRGTWRYHDHLYPQIKGTVIVR